MEFLNLVIENWDSISGSISGVIAALIGIMGAVVSAMTVINRILPGVVSDSMVGKAAAFTDKLSIGTKQTKVIKK